MWTSIWLIIKQSLAFIQRNAAVLAAIVITAIITAFCTWHVREALGQDTITTVDTTSIVRHAVDSTRGAMQGQAHDSATYWRKRVITRWKDGQPVITTVVDSGGYELASFWEYAYNELLVKNGADTTTSTTTAPVPAGKRFGVALCAGPGFDGLKLHGLAVDVPLRYRSLYAVPGVSWEKARFKPTGGKLTAGIGW
jgi:hypothetical protein